MKKEVLAAQLREGHAWRFADGLAVISGCPKEFASAWDLITAAATCNACDQSMSDEEIEQAVEEADSMDSFRELVASQIEHDPDCIAD